MECLSPRAQTHTHTPETDTVQDGSHEPRVTTEYMRGGSSKSKCAVSTKHTLDFKDSVWGFPGGAVVKNPPATRKK